MKIDRIENRGIVYDNDKALFTFEVLSSTEQAIIDADKANFQNSFVYGETFQLEGYSVASYGSLNNLPGELRFAIKSNHLLPEILKKQVRYLFGTGPYLYKKKIEGDKVTRIPMDKEDYTDVFQWLDSWEKRGISKSFSDYSKLVIQEYYYTEGIFTKYVYNKSRRISGDMPIRGLEYIPSTRARFAKKGVVDPLELIEDEDFNFVLYSRWDYPSRFEFEVFNRYDPSNPFKFPVCINYIRDLGFGEEIYSYPTFYYGLLEWIKMSNLNPKYINSYLKNSLNAKLHVIIPNEWILSKEASFQQACETNQKRKSDGDPLIDELEGVPIGTVYNYSQVQKLIDNKLRQLTAVLSGSGENQGKMFVSRAFATAQGIEKWEFADIPTKYKEFLTSIIDLDKRAVKVILEGKGVDPSISNVSNEGVFQGSGSNAYYNYIIYLSTLNYAEDYCTADINNALEINFPRLLKEGIKLGFFRNVPDRQQDIQPDERIEKTTNLN